MTNIPVWGVILSAVAAMVIGSLWYSNLMFGKAWKSMMGVSDKQLKKIMPYAMVMLVVIALLTAYVLAHFIIYVHRGTTNGWVEAGAKTALWAWAGLALTTVFVHGIWDKRDKRLMLINAGDRLITLVAMGLILGAFFK